MQTLRTSRLLAIALALFAGRALAQDQPLPPDPVTGAPRVHTTYGDTRRAWRAKNFAEIDAIADRVVRERAIDKYSRPELESVFMALDAEEPKRLEGWPAYLAALDAWIAAAPTSATAPVTKTKALIDYAWLARGSGSGSSVTPEGWQLFRERLEQARAILDSSRAIAGRCPQWYASALVLARGQGWNRAEADAVVNEGLTKAGWYLPIYQSMIVYLLPRWFGKPGEWQAFLLKAVEDKGEEGAAMYALVLDRALVRYSDEELFLTPYAVDWPLMRAGFDDVLRRYPDPFIQRHAFRAACLAGDRDKARAMFVQSAFALDYRPFSNEGELAAWKAWSEGGPLPPARDQQTKVFEAWKALKDSANRPPAQVTL